MPEARYRRYHSSRRYSEVCWFIAIHVRYSLCVWLQRVLLHVLFLSKLVVDLTRTAFFVWRTVPPVICIDEHELSQDVKCLHLYGRFVLDFSACLSASNRPPRQVDLNPGD